MLCKSHKRSKYQFALIRVFLVMLFRNGRMSSLHVRPHSLGRLEGIGALQRLSLSIWVDIVVMRTTELTISFSMQVVETLLDYVTKVKFAKE